MNQNPETVSILVLKELPPRSENLSMGQIKQVFGGCSHEGGICLKSSDCCDPEEKRLMRVCTSQFKCLYV